MPLRAMEVLFFQLGNIVVTHSHALLNCLAIQSVVFCPKKGMNGVIIFLIPSFYMYCINYNKWHYDGDIKF